MPNFSLLHTHKTQIDSPSKSTNDISIISFDGDHNLDSMETIKEKIINEYPVNKQMETINPSMLQYISMLGNKK